MMFRAVDPATEKTLCTHEGLDADALERALASAADAFTSWRRVPYADRAAPMRRVGALLRERRDALAALMTAEMGKPITQALGEVDKCALVCDFYADGAARMLTPELVSTDASLSMVRYDPLGAVLAIMPWNLSLIHI